MYNDEHYINVEGLKSHVNKFEQLKEDITSNIRNYRRSLDNLYEGNVIAGARRAPLNRASDQVTHTSNKINEQIDKYIYFINNDIIAANQESDDTHANELSNILDSLSAFK